MTPRTDALVDKHAKEYDSGKAILGHQYSELADHARKLERVNADLLSVARFFLLGIEGGHIKCAPYIDFDPDAESLDIKSPADRLRTVIARAEAA